MRERFWVAPDEFADPSEPIRPQTMRDLLRELDVADQPEDLRADAIREWLKTNKPTPMMEFCLVDEGYLGHASDRA